MTKPYEESKEMEYNALYEFQKKKEWDKKRDQTGMECFLCRQFFLILSLNRKCQSIMPKLFRRWKDGKKQVERFDMNDRQDACNGKTVLEIEMRMKR